MADIFLSYTRADAVRAGQLAEQLEARGLTVFWDTEVLPGQRWRDVIHQELVDARCVIVIWSSESSRSRWVVEEASEALETGKLVPVLLDGTLPPFGFRGVEAANLSGWIPGAQSPEFENLVNAVRGIVDATPAAETVDPAPDLDRDTAPAVGDELEQGGARAGDDSAGVDAAAGPGASSDETGTAARDEPPAAGAGDGGSATEPATTGLPEAEADPGDRPGARHDEMLAGTSGAETPATTPTTETPATTFRAEPEPPPPNLLERLGTGGIAALGAAAVLLVVLLVIFAGGDRDGGNGPGTTIAGGTTTSDATSTSAREGEIVETDTVTAFLAATPPSIDGDLRDWAGVPEFSRMRQEVFRDSGVTERLGADSPGVVAAQFDEAALYLAVVSEDDVYSQLNTGNQIWRGDALDINLTTATGSAISERPDGDDFQLTMTPRDAEGRAATVWFTGNGSGFFDNTTSQPVTLAGSIEPGGSWVLEAAIPWSVFGLGGPPESDLAALLAVFDNDGEVVDGTPRQTVILGHTDAQFQRPLTWGTLRLER